MSSIPTHIDRYDILRRLGKGGMGAVYLAYDPQLGRTVAIKVLAEHSDELRARFAREARSAAALKHHNIVTIYDFGEHDGQPFLAMEYIEGETLAELIARRAPLPLSRKIEFAHDLCTGLGYAHRTGIVHRDIKPANVMVTTEGTLKILDFGLARVVSEATQLGLTGAGMMVGTPYYMAPEQIQGKPVDQRTDIFSVGLVIYELLAGQRAFPGDSPYTVIYKVLNTQPEPLERLVPGIDPALATLVRRASEKDPANRYQDLTAMGAELQRLRQRHQSATSDKTIILARTDQTGEASPHDTTTPQSPLAGTPRVSTRDLERRRSEQIQYHVQLAQKHFAAKRYEAAIEQCEAAELIEPEEPRVLEMLRRAQAALDDQRVAALAGEARERLATGALSRAEQLLGQIRSVRPDAAEADALQGEIARHRADQERAADRARAVRAATDRGVASFAAGSFEAAVRSADEALAHDAADAEAIDLKARANAALEARRAEDERARREAAERARAEAAERARVEAAERARAEAAERARVEAAERERAEAAERARAEAAERARMEAAERARAEAAERAQSAAAAARAAAAPARIDQPSVAPVAPLHARRPVADAPSLPRDAAPTRTETAPRRGRVAGHSGRTVWLAAGAVALALVLVLAIAFARRTVTVPPTPSTDVSRPSPPAPKAPGDTATPPSSAAPVTPTRPSVPAPLPAPPVEARPDRAVTSGPAGGTPATTKPASAPDPIAELQNLARSPERQQRTRALQLAQSLLQRSPGDARVQGIVAGLRGGAEADVDRARSEAQAAGADDRWPAEWRQARDRERAARASAPPDAVRGFWAAAEMYAQAAARAGRAAQVVQDARTALRSEPDRALTIVVANAREYGDSPAFRDLVATLASGAVAESERAAREAVSAGKTSTQPFRDAAEQQRLGRQALAAGHAVDGIQALTRATSSYRIALRTDGASSTPPPAPAPAAAAAPVAPPPAATAPGAGGAGAAVAAAQVNSLLRRMETAYESKSTEAVKRVLPNIEFKDLVRLDSDFKEFKTIDMEIALDRLEPAGNDRFVAHCIVTRLAQPKAGRAIRRTYRMAFTLKRFGDEWRVESQSPES